MRYCVMGFLDQKKGFKYLSALYSFLHAFTTFYFLQDISQRLKVFNDLLSRYAEPSSSFFFLIYGLTH